MGVSSHQDWGGGGGGGGGTTGSTEHTTLTEARNCKSVWVREILHILHKKSVMPRSQTGNDELKHCLVFKSQQSPTCLT